MKNIIDSHIHLDLYDEHEVEEMMGILGTCSHLVSVSFHLESCRRNLHLAEKYHQVRPAFGYHPEQELPSEEKLQDLISWIESRRKEMVAVGEIGLPYYLRKEIGSGFSTDGYIELLEEFLKLAKKLNKPVILHAVYDDAPIVCDLLEKHGVNKVHFHWFKGDGKTVERMAENGYFISVTPDVTYEKEIQELVRQYPLGQMMVETDGPWGFEGSFAGKMTHPRMIHQSIAEISAIKKHHQDSVYETLYDNTLRFYKLNQSY